MAYNEELTNRLRKALKDVPNVEELKMFRGVSFMINGKVCMSVGDDEIMYRIDPAMHDELLKRKGTRTMTMKTGREYKGYIEVNEEGRKTQKDFDFWLNLALEFNKKAKAAPKKKGKK